MKRHLIHKEENQFWMIETADKSHTITEGKIGKKGTSQTTDFTSNYKVRDDVSDKVKAKIRAGYEFFIPIPDNLFTELGENQEHNGPFIVVDFDNKKEVIEKLEKGLQYIKDYLESGVTSFKRIDSDLVWFREKSEDIKMMYQEVDFFDKVLEIYPDLETKVMEWLDFAISIRGIHTEYGQGSYLFQDVASALLKHDKKHLDKFLAYLHTWDWDHETDDESELIEDLIVRYRATSEEGLKLIAARRLSLAGQHGNELELNEYLEDVDEETINRFFQLMMLNLLKDNHGQENKRLTDPTNAAHYREAKQTVDYYISDILSELGIDFDEERMVMAVANIDKNNPHHLTDILNPDYDIPLSTPFCITLGHEETKKRDLPKSIQYFSQAIEQDPQSADAFLGRGYAHYCANDLKSAEQDWVKSLELFPDSITSKRNLIEVYMIHSPDYPKALKLVNQLIDRQSYYKAGDYIRRGGIYELMGEMEKSEEDYQKGLTSREMGDHLNYVEFKIFLNQFEKAHKVLKNRKIIKKQKTTTNSMVIAHLFKCIALIGMEKEYEKEKAQLYKHFEKGSVYSKWNFQVINAWLPKSNLSEEQKKEAQELIAFIEENRSTNY